MRKDCPLTKAVGIGQAIEMGEDCALVSLYLDHDGFTALEARTLTPPGAGSDPLRTVIGRKSA